MPYWRLAGAAPIDAFTAPNPIDQEQHRIIIYEVEEGGIGILHSLVNNEALLRKLFENALEVIHYNLETQVEESYACTKACYNCLLHYWNQREHHIIDRDLVKDTLL